MLPPDHSQTLAQTPTLPAKKADPMSQLRTAKAVDVQAFPGSTFVVDDTPPIAQCQESQLVEALVPLSSGDNFLEKAGIFTGINLAGKKLDITASTNNDGTFNVLSNTDDIVIIDHTISGPPGTCTLTVHDVGQAYLTRNEPSFQRFIENEGQAHTTKGGQLFTDTPSPPMNAACSDTFDPQ